MRFKTVSPYPKRSNSKSVSSVDVERNRPDALASHPARFPPHRTRADNVRKRSRPPNALVGNDRLDDNRPPIDRHPTARHPPEPHHGENRRARTDGEGILGRRASSRRRRVSTRESAGVRGKSALQKRATRGARLAVSCRRLQPVARRDSAVDSVAALDRALARLAERLRRLSGRRRRLRARRGGNSLVQ